MGFENFRVSINLLDTPWISYWEEGRKRFRVIVVSVAVTS